MMISPAAESSRAARDVVLGAVWLNMKQATNREIIGKLACAVFFLWFLTGAALWGGVTVTTLDGTVYEDAEVASGDSKVVVLTHSKGSARVALTNLSKEDRKLLKLTPTLELAKADFEAQVEKLKYSIEELNANYEKHLAGLEKQSVNQGLLEQILEIREEKAKFREGAPAKAIKSDRLKQLRAIYEAERDKIRADTEDKLTLILNAYLAELSALQASLTKAHEFDAAVLVRNERDRILPLHADPGAAVATLGILKYVRTPQAPEAPKKPAPAPGSIAETPASATRETPFENSLGMRFVPVPVSGGPSDGKVLLFCIWETRVQDYEAFIKRNRDQKWTQPEFRQEDTHPAVDVSWDGAVAFCEWLTEKEQRDQTIEKDMIYRLPTDHEWSNAVGIGHLEDPSSPILTKRGELADTYPWRGSYPPEGKAGNYYGEEAANNPFQTGRIILNGYNDGFDRTAPVGSFEANELGLYDLGGNAWEWCQDWYDPGSETRRAFRGGAWVDSASMTLRSSIRGGYPPESGSVAGGFRVVLARK